jgi:hypothetical protein
MPGSGNQGGFRAAGTGEDKKFTVLYTSGEDRNWPDHLDLNTGQFVYFGDNKTPGHERHETSRIFQMHDLRVIIDEIARASRLGDN